VRLNITLAWAIVLWGLAYLPALGYADDPIPATALPPAKIELPPEVATDEPAVFQEEGVVLKPKILQQQKVEEQSAVLMEADKPDFIPLFFAPEKNGVIYSHQELEYDLTDPLVLRVGPLAVTAAGVVMRMSRETGQFFEFEFGLDLKKRFANMYMVSFQWPNELIPDGALELLNDEGKVIYRTEVAEERAIAWRKFVEVAEQEVVSESAEKKAAAQPKKTGALNPRPVTRVGAASLRRMGHDQSSFGLFGGDIFEIPIWKIADPFRFCITKDSPEGRIALCSKRYRFIRKGGLYSVIAENKNVVAKVMVNDKPVTLKGSAVFIDEKRPIKFAALMGNGTYFEFVSFPKHITIVDMVHNDKTDKVEVIGFGAPPLGPIQRIDRRAPDYWDFLNIASTIGDFRKFWKAEFPAHGGNLYLRGYGGAPFRQPFVYERLPRRSTRPLIHIRSPKGTYSKTVTLKGETSDPVKVSSKEESAESTTPTSFDWEFLARERGILNSSEIAVRDGKYTFHAFHEVYKGFPREFSLRTSGVVTSDLNILVLGEAAAHYWFEKIVGWDNTRWSHQRWGVNAKYFQSLVSIGGKKDDNGQKMDFSFRATTLDLKYRLTPGIWARDPTLGVMAQAQMVRIDLAANNTTGAMGGVGAFWARSMPKIFDDLFNIIPFLRYPKWVDVEGVLFFMPLTGRTVLNVSGSVNFHGKILWSQRFFGEAGFGLKAISFGDKETNKVIPVNLAYGTVGLGVNF
jgi:hypothetical protein